jgi:hypothetical protein
MRAFVPGKQDFRFCCFVQQCRFKDETIDNDNAKFSYYRGGKVRYQCLVALPAAAP